MRKIFIVFIGILAISLSACNSNNLSKGGQEPEMTGTFIDVIDPLSSSTFDYKNPSSGVATIGLTSSYAYTLNGVDTYEICKLFEEVPVTIVDNVEDTEYLSAQSRAIILTVDYRYTSQQSADSGSLTSVVFFIHEDGTLSFRNARGDVYMSESDKINYDSVINLLTATK